MAGEEEEHFGARPPVADPASVSSWVIYEDAELLVVNKPGWLVCHPSKHGECSSLVGVCRVYCGVERLHLVARLDRETSGVVLLAKTARAANIYQTALENRQVAKSYLCILQGTLPEAVSVDLPVVRDADSPVAIKRKAMPAPDAPVALTHFDPLMVKDGWTLAHARPVTGRTHQIRVHAAYLGFPIAGDKLYGPDEDLYLTFVREGWTPRHAALLPMCRQALHAARVTFRAEGFVRTFEAPLPEDMRTWCEQHLGLARPESLLP